MTIPPRVRVVGPGRAGGSLATALARVGWVVEPPLGRGDKLAGAARDVDLVIISTPDPVIADAAREIDPVERTVVAHLAGSRGLDLLGDHPRTAVLHPLVAMPDPTVGAARLLAGAWFAVAGDPLVQRVASDLGGRWFPVGDDDRATYHAAAVVASNHLVALLGQVERMAEGIGVPTEAFWDLARGSLENVAEIGAAAALTGPVARRDWDTVRRHLNALDPSEREAYRAMAAAALRLVDAAGELPPDLR